MPSNPSSWPRELSAGTFAPRRVEVALERLDQAWTAANLAETHPLEPLLRQFPMGSAGILKLLASSSISTEKLIRDPESLLWLNEPEICQADRTLWQMQVDLARLKGRLDRFDPEFKILRKFKSRELLRIALREVTTAAPLHQTALEVSLVAEICVKDVMEGWRRKLMEQYGEPQSALCALGMGKLGGRELNYSSDIDLIFVYSEEGQLNRNFSYHQFYNRVVEQVVKTFSESSPAGALFRIDLRLRPEGDCGPLARGVESMENYYAAYGETWERMALAKARCIAGEEELGYEILQRLQPFVYPRHVSPEMLDEIAHTKGRLEREVAGLKNRRRDIKNGWGGIREIEFVVQSIQLLHGSRHPFLQQPSTLKTLNALRSLEHLNLIGKEDARTLETAYHFLRTLEHRLMIEGEQQTHTLPSDAEALGRLAASLEFPDVYAFQTRLAEITDGVRRIFETHFESREPETVPDLTFFQDPELAAKRLRELGEGSQGANLSPRTRRIFRQFEPALVRALGQTVEPDQVLGLFYRYLEAYRMRGTLFELLMQYPKLLGLITRMFDASPALSETVIRFPDLVEAVARSSDLDERLDAAGFGRKLEASISSADEISPLDQVRVFRRFQLFRILLRDVMEVATLEDIQMEYTALAEACLTHILHHVGGEELTVVAMGKFGAEELSFGADLDVMLVGNSLDPARKLMSEYGRVSDHGGLDEIDLRLRPEGNAGPAVTSVAAFERYHQGRGQPWEAQALTRARILGGTEAESFRAAVDTVWRRAGQSPDLFPNTHSMLDRIAAERVKGNGFVDFKSGKGGMVAIEFVTQVHQMRAGVWEPNTLRAIGKLREAGVWNAAAAESLAAAYRFLQRCGFVLRRYHNRAISTLPERPEDQIALAKRLGFEGLDDFQRRYQGIRGEAEEWVGRLLV